MLNEMMPLTENSTGDRPRILVVEDDPQIGELLQEHLTYSLNADLRVADSAEQALQMDSTKPAELILIDYMLPDMDGLELTTILRMHVQRPVIVMTGHPTLGRAIEAMRLGATDMFVKPFDLERMTNSISQAVAKYRFDQLRIRRLMRVRELSKRVLHERRGLRRKMDLVCRDMVVGYRELAEKVNRIQDSFGDS